MVAACNNTLETIPVSDVKLSIGITFHELGLIISAASGLIAIAITGYLIIQHALHYKVPQEQKHIIRILFMIPIYAVVSFVSYYNYKHAIYFEVIRDCYEAFAIASFFTLICAYLAPSLHDQKDYFRTLTPKNWIWPLNWCQPCTGGKDRGWLKRPTSGLTWFNINYLGVFQYCFIRVLMTIVALLTQLIGRYCQESFSPAFAYFWVTVFDSISVFIAMYTLIQFVHQLWKDLPGRRPLLKLACIKLVIFFSFWQTLVLDALSTTGVIGPSDTIASPDIKVGIPSMLLCIEMALFAILHIFAFPWHGPYGTDLTKTPFVTGQPYQIAPTNYVGGFLGWRALADAFNPWDIVKAAARSFRWLFVGRKTRKDDVSYQHARDESGAWGGAGAFAGDEDDNSKTYPRANGAQPRQPFTPLVNGGGGAQSIPLQDTTGLSPPRYSAHPGPHQGRGGLSRLQSEDDDTWGMHVDDDDGSYAPSMRRSFEGGEEDRAGLLLRASQPGVTGASRTGISPARSEISMGESPERERGGAGRAPPGASSAAPGGFDKETQVEEQFKGYGRYSWGKDPREG